MATFKHRNRPVWYITSLQSFVYSAGGTPQGPGNFGLALSRGRRGHQPPSMYSMLAICTEIDRGRRFIWCSAGRVSGPGRTSSTGRRCGPGFWHDPHWHSPCFRMSPKDAGVSPPRSGKVLALPLPLHSPRFALLRALRGMLRSIDAPPESGNVPPSVFMAGLQSSRGSA